MYKYSIYVCTMGATDRIYALESAWDQRVDEAVKFWPSQKEKILTFFSSSSFSSSSPKCISTVLLTFQSIHTWAISHSCLTVSLLRDQSHWRDPPLLLTDFQTDVIRHDYIVTVMRLEGDKYVVGWVELRSTSTVLLDRWAPNLHGKGKLQCEGMRPDLGEITHENHTCQVKNRTQSSYWTVPSKALWKDALPLTSSAWRATVPLWRNSPPRKLPETMHFLIFASGVALQELLLYICLL